jgi:Na+/H+ antiporter NhaD/arsenite permease-like protein
MAIRTILLIFMQRLNKYLDRISLPFNPSSRYLVIIILAGLVLLIPGETYASSDPQQDVVEVVIVGQVLDTQGVPVVDAEVIASTSDQPEPLVEVQSQEDGSWVLAFPEKPLNDLEITVARPHFHTQTINLHGSELRTLNEDDIYQLEDVILERRISAGFWVATIVFVGVLLLIAFELLHSTTAALAGVSIIFLTSYVGGALNPNLFILSYERGLSYIDWEVVFLVMGMMIIIAIVEGTGIFQWLAFQAYRISRGRTWLLVLILMLITALASALLDNFTTMLLMTPISLQIGLALGINPLALIIPQVLASNVGGISTLVGTPTNILIGAYAGISFTDFLVNQTVGVILALIVMAGFILLYYRKEYRQQGGGISPKLYQKLEENARIEDPQGLWKSGVVFALVLVGFILGERIHLALAVTAIAGATLLLVWLKPDVQHMIKAVDWTTLVFFMTLFMIVGAIQEVGLISLVAEGMSRLIGENLLLGIFVIVFGVGTLSTVIANIPLTAAMLPIIRFLTASIPGAQSLVLYYALSIGAAMGGNGTLIGGEANLVTAGITEQANTPITFKEFLKVGLPVTYLTLMIGFLWLVYHFQVY